VVADWEDLKSERLRVIISEIDMPKLHETDPENYEMCGSCIGLGTKTQLEKIECPKCEGSGSIKKNRASQSPANPRSNALFTGSKEELMVQFDQELSKAKKMKASLLAAIPSSVLLSPESIYFADKLISSIDPLSKNTDASLEDLQRDWSQRLPTDDSLFILLSEFKTSCYAAETYRSLVQ
jgi:hypothetical protein